MILESIGAKIGASVASNIVKGTLKAINKSDEDKYEKELSKIIDKTIDEYKRSFSVGETNRIPFYESEIVIRQLMEFRLTNKLEKTAFEDTILNDSRIIPPSKEQLTSFLNLFDQNVNDSHLLREQFIDLRYKETILATFESLDSLAGGMQNAIKEIKAAVSEGAASTILQEEWNTQLTEIKENIESFKPLTALQRLAKLEDRVINSGQSESNKKVLGQIYYLKAICAGQIDDTSSSSDEAKNIIKCFGYQPQNLLFQSHAILAYYILEDHKKAIELAEKVLLLDEYNIQAWAMKCIGSGTSFKYFLESVPNIVKDNNVFRSHIYRWVISKGFANTTSEIEKLGLAPAINTASIPSITYRNISSQLDAALYALVKYHESHGTFMTVLSSPNAKEDPNFVYGNKSLKNIFEAVKGSEIENYFLQYAFRYFVTRVILDGNKSDVLEMERIYNSLPDDKKSHDMVIQMAQGFNLLNETAATRKGISIIESFTGEKDKFLYFLNALNYMTLGDHLKQQENFINYLEATKEVTQSELLNIFQFFRHAGVEIDETMQLALEKSLARAAFASPVLQTLMEIFLAQQFHIGINNKESINALLDKAIAEVPIDNKQLILHTAFALCQAERMEDAKVYLENKIDFDVPSEALRLYCKILFKLQGNKPELLRLLKKCRENFAPNAELLDMELYLKKLQHQWDEAIEIGKNAVQHYPSYKPFLFELLYVANMANRISIIIEYAPKLENFDFESEHDGQVAAAALLKAGLKQQALDIQFQMASNDQNIHSRQRYVNNLNSYAGELLKDYPKVISGSFVKYIIKGKINIVEVTEINQGQFPQSSLIGKNTGETFSITISTTSRIEQVTILRVCDKYLALLEEILTESNDPLNSLGMQIMELGDGSPESIMQTFIDTFGAQGSVRKLQTDKSLEEYFNGRLSFGEITRDVFKNHFVDAYYSLIHQSENCFKAISPAPSRRIVVNDKTTFVLDSTAVCLFHQLSTESGLIFAHKFAISKYLKEAIVKELEDLNTRQPSMKFNITHDAVRPLFLGEDYYETRKKLFESLLKWIDSNCEVLQVPERLNFIMGIDAALKSDDHFQMLLENRLMADRTNHILLTNDTFYFRLMNGIPSTIASPVFYLERFQTEKSKEYLEFMASKRYVGIPTTAAILQDELIKMIAGNTNNSSTSLENLRYNWNPDRLNIVEAIEYLKNLYSESVIPDDSRERIAQSVLANLVTGMPPLLLAHTLQTIRQKFKLMGLHLDTLLRIFNQIST